MPVFIATKLVVSIQSALLPAVTATAVTLANPGVVTAAGHGLATGDYVVWGEVVGMSELSYQAVRVIVNSVDEFQLEDLDTSNFTAFTSGTFQAIDTWTVMDNAQSISMPDVAPEKIDISKLIDSTKQYVLGVPDAPEGSISGLFDPKSAAMVEVKAAQDTKTTRVLLLEWVNGSKTVLNAYVSGGQGFEAAFNTAVTSSIAFTPQKQWITYAA